MLARKILKGRRKKKMNKLDNYGKERERERENMHIHSFAKFGVDEKNQSGSLERKSVFEV